MLYLWNTFYGVETSALSTILGTLLDFLAVLIAGTAAYFALKTLNEQTRPYVSANFDIDFNKSIINLVIVNSGNRGASDVKCKFNPSLVSTALSNDAPNKELEILSFSYLAPKQTIISFFDTGVARYPDNVFPDSDAFEVDIYYSYMKRKFSEKYTIDLGYAFRIAHAS